jgi:1,4-dihydroxy-2-naphthoate octaprenyltransferase
LPNLLALTLLWFTLNTVQKTNHSPVKVWISAFRLRTLPLSLSSIIIGGALAIQQSAFNPIIFGLCFLTTLFLQILSNLANDYGDSIHGADGDHRKGPKRTVQSGAITKVQMFKAIIIFASLAFLSGVVLLWVALEERTYLWPYFLGAGILAIAAAIFYTNGKRPYGYLGLGDISVLLFFGPVGVLGTWFLQSEQWNPWFLLPAFGIGFLATGVLNVNNIRDIESDTLAGKKSIPVIIGRKSALLYHSFLLALGYIGLVFTFPHLGIATFSLLAIMYTHNRSMRLATTIEGYDPQLKVLSLIALAQAILFLLKSLQISGLPTFIL